MKTYSENVACLALMIAKETGDYSQAALDFADLLVFNADVIQRYHEDACNDPSYDEEDRKRLHNIEKSLGDLIRDYHQPLGFIPGSGDPRGYPFYLSLPSGRSNSWGGEGWGVNHELHPEIE
jgi:hypothetical protein